VRRALLRWLSRRACGEAESWATPQPLAVVQCLAPPPLRHTVLPSAGPVAAPLAIASMQLVSFCCGLDLLLLLWLPPLLPPLLQVKQGVDLPQWLAYASSSLTFGGGLLGISYGIMSGEEGLHGARAGSGRGGRASWDCSEGGGACAAAA
jgi:hypothetical protein